MGGGRLATIGRRNDNGCVHIIGCLSHRTWGHMLGGSCKFHPLDPYRLANGYRRRVSVGDLVVEIDGKDVLFTGNAR